ncbi:MAG TPA: hypothetical protein ENH23_04940 [candidate division Zixibacteria bacterium]|nr:hypothetical protein [candidate division Zixibacteria bacterium]
MDIDFEDLKSITDEALLISTIKMLVFKGLKEKLDANENELDVILETLNEKPNDFFKPDELEFITQIKFNDFITNLTEKILNEFQ